MGQTALKMWCATLRKRLCSAGVIEKRDPMDIWREAVIIAATIAAVIVPFLVVPELLERRGYNPRSAFVRGIIWASFLAIVLVPATAVGYVFTVTNLVDWLLAVGFLTIAILCDYYRLNPEKVPWLRSRT